MKPNVRFVLSSFLICILLVACGPSQAEVEATAAQAAANDSATRTAQAPTTTATFTPSPTATLTPTPTATPEPTNTPTPVPTDTPVPTSDPFVAGEFVDGKLVLTTPAYLVLMVLGDGWHSDGYYSSEIFLYNAMLEYNLQPDQLAETYASLGKDYTALGHYDLALENYLRMLDLKAASGDMTSYVLNEVCWIYTITNQAQDALPYCEESVALDPASANLDSRGVAYAVLGRYEEAANDFEAALELDGWPSEGMKTERQEWLTALKAGTNPITSDVLERELIDEVPLTDDPFYTGDLKLSYLRSTYEEMGYVFEEVTLGEMPGLMGVLVDGDCMTMIALVGDEQQFLGGNSTIVNCNDDETSARLWQFNYGFVRDFDELARALVWQSADYYYVIEGKQVTDLSPTFGGFVFTVERSELNGEQAIVISAMPPGE